MRASQNGKCLDGRVRKNTGRDRKRDSNNSPYPLQTGSLTSWMMLMGQARSRRASVVSAGLDNGAS